MVCDRLDNDCSNGLSFLARKPEEGSRAAMQILRDGVLMAVNHQLKQCPKCNQASPMSAKFCGGCGHTFSTPAVNMTQAIPNQAVSPVPIAHSSPLDWPEHRTARFIFQGLWLLATLMFIFGTLTGFAMMFYGPSQGFDKYNVLGGIYILVYQWGLSFAMAGVATGLKCAVIAHARMFGRI